MLVLFLQNGNSQTPIPFVITNNSEIPDNELFVAIVGQDLTPDGAHIWVDMKNGNQMPMSTSYNTVKGPEINGNKGPGGNGMYADCFTKLSDIPNKTVTLKPIQGCRMFIGIKSQLYLYFFGSTGAQRGYASPSHSNPTDPSTGINYEIIELTYNQYGFWGNTSRVDSYNYAMALELTDNANSTKKTGELLSHSEIGKAYLANVPIEFQACYNAKTGQIFQPTKTKEFADGTVGTMPIPGIYKDYMKPYIDQVWAKYANEDLIFSSGDAGVWKGRVVNEQFVFTCIQGGFINRKGIITRRPSTQEAFEGKGVLDNIVSDGTADLMIQAQICAALTRHLIDVKTPNVGQQIFSDPTKYYQESPCNHYAKFWHLKGISADQKSYGFAYDDVFDQSATLHSPTPKSVNAILGGYSPKAQTPYNGVRQVIPGTIEAEKYDEGGEGLAFHDLTSNNQGNSTLRNDAVDIETANGVVNVGYIENGEWLDYSVNVNASGTYQATLTFAAEGAGGAFTLLVDDVEVVSNKNTGTTGGWQNWGTVVVSGVNLTAGNHILTFKANTGNFNLDKISFHNDVVLSTLSTSFSSEIIVYPNPTSGLITVQGVSNTTKISIYSLQGTLVKEVVGNQVSVQELNAGTYYLNSNDAGNVFKTLIIKQ